MLSLDSLETPCLVVDRHRLLRNAQTMLARARDLGVALRPHVKTPKSVEIARLSLGADNGPITVSTLLEAEHFAAHGFDDILYAVGIALGKLPRLAALQGRTGATIRFVLDSVAVAEAVAAFAQQGHSGLQALIEIDSGEHRSGLLPDDPALPEIAAVLADAPGVELVGVMTHAGHSYGTDDPAKIRAIADAERDAAVSAAETLRSHGHACPVVSVGSTPTVLHAGHLHGVTKARAGVYVFWDLAQASRGVCGLHDIAATVLSTVIGHNRQAGRLILDAGALALSKDVGANNFMPDAGYGFVCDAATAEHLAPLAVTEVHQEHGAVPVPDASWFDRLPIGSLVRVMPNHTCMTCAAHRGYHVLENGEVVAEWPRVNGW
ncbi:alanine racemase [Dichotomicrobium thermohalophilum]|uniref:D-serine deaminase-like pyridoxal phosphate-dependent protein n=1 Tax=Dichotomicrobium thermohalophilum TaxID=933063 RepID=A0A397Q637_9HYPH|nr:alanine racemase [Dichotomicrobium thermohalophilum]RIA55275.1 D-serine deaminase-like pyridoxal phosphate-dependent protein [Dichotomicrobium thermohalophilum]